MKQLRIHNHDGSIQIITPKQEPGQENNFQGDFKGLAETICRKAYPSTHPEELPGHKLYRSLEVL